MDALGPQFNMRDDAHLNKRRRFCPALNLETGWCDAGDGPLLQRLSGRSPTQQDIQRELLQVGMRIRKSVSDGYKTTAFTPRPFFNMHRLSPATQAALCSDTMKRQPLSTATFCGINLAALAYITSTPVEPPRLWSYSTSHKRGYEDESDSDDQEFMPATPTLDHEQELGSMPVEVFSLDFVDSDEIDLPDQSDQSRTPQPCGRRMAQPRSRLQPSKQSQQQANVNPFAQLQILPDHQRISSCSVEATWSLIDFDEAPFLQKREDFEMDCS